MLGAAADIATWSIYDAKCRARLPIVGWSKSAVGSMLVLRWCPSLDTRSTAAMESSPAPMSGASLASAVPTRSVTVFSTTSSMFAFAITWTGANGRPGAAGWLCDALETPFARVARGGDLGNRRGRRHKCVSLFTSIIVKHPALFSSRRDATRWHICGGFQRRSQLETGMSRIEHACMCE